MVPFKPPLILKFNFLDYSNNHFNFFIMSKYYSDSAYQTYLNNALNAVSTITSENLNSRESTANIDEEIDMAKQAQKSSGVEELLIGLPTGLKGVTQLPDAYRKFKATTAELADKWEQLKAKGTQLKEIIQKAPQDLEDLKNLGKTTFGKLTDIGKTGIAKVTKTVTETTKDLKSHIALSGEDLSNRLTDLKAQSLEEFGKIKSGALSSVSDIDSLKTAFLDNVKQRYNINTNTIENNINDAKGKIEELTAKASGRIDEPFMRQKISDLSDNVTKLENLKSQGEAEVNKYSKVFDDLKSKVAPIQAKAEALQATAEEHVNNLKSAGEHLTTIEGEGPKSVGLLERFHKGLEDIGLKTKKPIEMQDLQGGQQMAPIPTQETSLGATPVAVESVRPATRINFEPQGKSSQMFEEDFNMDPEAFSSDVRRTATVQVAKEVPIYSEVSKLEPETEGILSKLKTGYSNFKSSLSESTVGKAFTSVAESTLGKAVSGTVGYGLEAGNILGGVMSAEQLITGQAKTGGQKAIDSLQTESAVRSLPEFAEQTGKIIKSGVSSISESAGAKLGELGDSFKSTLSQGIESAKTAIGIGKSGASEVIGAGSEALEAGGIVAKEAGESALKIIGEGVLQAIPVVSEIADIGVASYGIFEGLKDLFHKSSPVVTAPVVSQGVQFQHQAGVY